MKLDMPKTYSKEKIDAFIDLLDFSKIKGGLVPMIAQDYETNEILMLAFANEKAVRQSLRTGIACYWSRSRQKLWKKGEESGHIQEIKHVLVDCYADTILLKVKQKVAACHTGHYSCFHREFEQDGKLHEKGEKIFDPDKVYNS